MIVFLEVNVVVRFAFPNREDEDDHLQFILNMKRNFTSF